MLLAGLVVGGLGVVEGAQRGVPVGFEGAGDEPVGGVDGEVAAAGRVGVVAGALDVGGARSAAGLGGSVLEFGGDLEGGLDGQRGEGGDEELADVLVEGVAGDGGADRAGVVDAVALAEVGGQVFPAAGVVADGHPAAAAAADDGALQQGGAFAGRSGGAVAAVGGGVGREQPPTPTRPAVHFPVPAGYRTPRSGSRNPQAAGPGGPPQFPPRPSIRSAPPTPGSSSRLRLQALHRFHGLHPDYGGSALLLAPPSTGGNGYDAAGFASCYGPHRRSPFAGLLTLGSDPAGPFPDRAASLLPGLLAATRTGLSPAGDDELTNDEDPPWPRSRLHLPPYWAHITGHYPMVVSVGRGR